MPKHTRITLEATADRFLAAALLNLPEVIAGMTNELTTAQDQCQEITGKTWFNFLSERETILASS